MAAIESIGRDLRFALRTLRKNPGFTAVALLSLALGIGANTALFSVVYGVLLHPYPYEKPEEIWTPGVRSLTANRGRGSYSLGEYLEMARLAPFSDVMATGLESVLLTGEYAPESFQAVLLSGNAFRFLGVPPLLGRTIQPSDERRAGAGRGPELPRVAAALPGGPERPRKDAAAERSAAHGHRRHAAALRLVG